MILAMVGMMLIVFPLGYQYMVKKVGMRVYNKPGITHWTALQHTLFANILSGLSQELIPFNSYGAIPVLIYAFALHFALKPYIKERKHTYGLIIFVVGSLLASMLVKFIIDTAA